MLNKQNHDLDERLTLMLLELQNELDGTTDQNRRSQLLNNMKLVYEMKKLNNEGDAKSREADAKVAEAEAKAKVNEAEIEKLKAEVKKLGEKEPWNKQATFHDLTLVATIMLILKHEKLEVITTKAFMIFTHLIGRV